MNTGTEYTRVIKKRLPSISQYMKLCLQFLFPLQNINNIINIIRIATTDQINRTVSVSADQYELKSIILTTIVGT